MHFLAALLLSIGAIAILILGTILKTSDKPFTDLGPAGDFFGGFANPIVAFLAFIGVVISVFVQRDALKEAKRQAAEAGRAVTEQMAVAERQTFESTLFQMLALHNEIISGISVAQKKYRFTGSWTISDEYDLVEVRGRNAFTLFSEQVSAACRTKMSNAGPTDDDVMSAFQEGFYEFWLDRRQDLGHYFRFLFNIVRYIDESRFAVDKRYMRLVRAQLSDHELLVLFYNCLSGQGEKFKILTEKYALLNNMPPDFDIDPFLRGQFAGGAFAQVSVDEISAAIHN